MARVKITDPDGTVKTPTADVVGAANETHELRDSRGRVLLIRKLTMLESMRFIRKMGAEAANNQAWMFMAVAGASVRAIDGKEFPNPPTSVEGAEAKMDEVGEDGLQAIQKFFEEMGEKAQTQKDMLAAAKN